MYKQQELVVFVMATGCFLWRRTWNFKQNFY